MSRAVAAGSPGDSMCPLRPGYRDEVASPAALNAMIEAADWVDDERRVGQDFSVEQPLLAALPAERLGSGQAGS